MDRNSAIGLTLIAILLLVYFYWFSPQPDPAVTDTTQSQPTVDSPTAAGPTPDSTDAVSPGDTAQFKARETFTTVENGDVRIVFSTKGGVIRELELKKYKTYWQTPLKLLTQENHTFSLLTSVAGKEVDLYNLFYDVEQGRSGDSTLVVFRTAVPQGGSVTQTYAIPAAGYQIAYRVAHTDHAANGSEPARFVWNEKMLATEKDLADTRNNSTINYCLGDGTFDNLSEMSEAEAETVGGPIQWVAMKKKFFLSAIIARKTFTGADISTRIDAADTSVVEHASAKLLIPKEDLRAGAAFKFYFGPNDYQEIGDVAEKFTRNVYLGWPPVYWINKFIIFPVFHFLTTFIANYGLIIVILVILLKLVLFPLSYKSYLSMAKMKVLKPELDAIKEKHGEDMTKVQQEQLKLYQQVGVNPISGCVPVLLQMPILFAMFYLFPASIELRQQPFLWAEDLSTYDSLIRLPFSLPFGTGSHISLFTLLMTISTLIYTWQNNQLSSVQGPMKSMSYIMPVIFFFFLNRFSAGLTFYYFVSNLVTFAQQAVIRRFVDEEKIKMVLEENRKRNLAGGGKKSRFMAKLEDAMKASEEARKRAEEEKKRRKK